MLQSIEHKRPKTNQKSKKKQRRADRRKFQEGYYLLDMSNKTTQTRKINVENLIGQFH
jgi:hypothetical protein